MKKLTISVLLLCLGAFPTLAQQIAFPEDVAAHTCSAAQGPTPFGNVFEQVIGSNPERTAAGRGGHIPLYPDVIIDEAGTPSQVFSLNGEFLVANSGNMNWEYRMFFASGTTFKKIKLDLDFTMGQWGGRVNDDPTDYGTDYYCLIWLNNGSSWDNMLAYVNFLYPRGQIEQQTNAGGYWDPPSYGLKLTTGCRPSEGVTYHFYWEYDAEQDFQYYRLTSGGSTVCEAGQEAGFPLIETNYLPIQFGSQYAAEGPEGFTRNWRFANFRIQLVGDDPINGRRPRRR